LLIAGATESYHAAFAIAEALAARDPANSQWQTDVVVSCSVTDLNGATLDAGT
jgi:hypothetical protein